LYNRRFEPRQPSGSLFVEEMSTAFADAKAEYVGEMYEHFGNCSRTEAYDRVYADLRLPFLMGPSVTGSIGEGIPHFSPLLDREGVNSSIRGPHRERLFSRWHRRMIARVAPELARQRTTEGLSARNGPLAIIDVPFYVADKIGRAAQKVAQRFNLPDIVQHAVEDPQTLPYTQELGLSGDAIRRARDFGILSERVASGQLSRAMFDRVLTAGLALLEMMP
jgi:hypothetical protein